MLFAPCTLHRSRRAGEIESRSDEGEGTRELLGHRSTALRHSQGVSAARHTLGSVRESHHPDRHWSDHQHSAPSGRSTGGGGSRGTQRCSTSWQTNPSSHEAMHCIEGRVVRRMRRRARSEERDEDHHCRRPHGASLRRGGGSRRADAADERWADAAAVLDRRGSQRSEGGRPRAPPHTRRIKTRSDRTT